MISKNKLLLSLAGAAIVAFIGAREYSASCEPPASAAAGSHAHDHGGGNHGHHEEEAGPHDANESLGASICEHGFLAALSERVGLSVPALAVKSDAVAHEDEKESGHDQNGSGEHGHDHDHGSHGKEGTEQEGLVKLTLAQIAASGIDVSAVTSGTLVKEIAAPGRIAVNANTHAKITPKLPGTVAKIMVQVGDEVKEDQLLATLESREIADAKSEFLAAKRIEELTKSVLVREQRLWKQKVTAKQDYLTAGSAHKEAVIKLDLAHQKLHAIGLSENEIGALSGSSDESGHRFYELRAPMAGRVVARDLVVGQVVTTDKEVFATADLSNVWVEIAVAPSDLAFAKVGQEVRVESGGRTGVAKVVFVSPTIDAETRSAKVVAQLTNTDDAWHLGDYVNAHLVSGGLDAALVVRRDAIQNVGGEKAVFVEEAGGFRVRRITTGREDATNVEILSGLEPGEVIATKNTFTLKSELGKAEAEHEH